ncbi:MAG TPA: phosphopantetheine-binding protein, partial [Vicinamibacterales bacterium]|nr:phosphopantetheine-binding protein [Vicinamibacterales bacterium]
ALRAMAETGRETHDDIAADRDEQRVIEIWVTLLGNSRIGSRSNFFELGGHSLLAIQAISRLRDAFGVEIPLRVFFGEPTPQGIARAIRAQALHGLTPLSPIPRVDRSSRRT